MQRADAFLFGRRTYELFAGFWGADEQARAAADDPGNNPIAAALNSRPKYLAIDHAHRTGLGGHDRPLR